MQDELQGGFRIEQDGYIVDPRIVSFSYYLEPRYSAGSFESVRYNEDTTDKFLNYFFSVDWLRGAKLPVSAKGEPDWSAALREGIVRPRALDPSDRAVESFRLDFFMRAEKTKFDAWFPHSSHLQWMGCDSCHPAVFEYLDNEITMKQIRAGESCGACHGSVAFSAKDCKRCHTKM